MEDTRQQFVSVAALAVLFDHHLFLRGPHSFRDLSLFLNSFKQQQQQQEPEEHKKRGALASTARIA